MIRTRDSLEVEVLMILSVMIQRRLLSPTLVSVCVLCVTKFKAFSHETAMVQVGVWVPTPLAVRKDQFSCEFLAQAHLQELCLHGSLCLLSA